MFSNKTRWMPIFFMLLSLGITAGLFFLFQSFSLLPTYWMFLTPVLITLSVLSGLSLGLLQVNLLLSFVLAQTLFIYLTKQYEISNIIIFILWLMVASISHLIATFIQYLRRDQFLFEESQEQDTKTPILVGLDSATGLSNKLSFDRAFLTEWKRSARTQRPIALLFIHLIEPSLTENSTALLGQISEILRNHARRPGDVSAYLDNQRFIVLLAETPLKNAHHVATQLMESIKNANFIDEKKLSIAVKINIAVYSQTPEVGSLNSLDLLQDAWTTLEIALEKQNYQVVCLG